MDKYVVTIARQFGSLGRPIGLRLAELLGVECYDRDIVEKAARQLDYSIHDISDQEETARIGLFGKMKFPLGNATTEKQDKIFWTQKKIINELADRESCIIVGRCSDAILAQTANSIHIYIYAPYKERLQNCVNELHMEENEAKKTMEEVDRARYMYHKSYAHFAPDDIEHKDILLNSALLGVEGSAKYLADLIRQKFN